jgi:hypothetical protein
MLKDHVRVFRAMRQFRLLSRTAEKLKEMGVTPQQVPLKLLFPIVENASIEESDELQDRWANLLARAADPKEASKFIVAFPAMLRELSQRHVKFLDALYDEGRQRMETRRKSGIEEISFGTGDLRRAFSDAGLARYPINPQGWVSAAESQRPDVIADYEEIGLAMDMFVRHTIFEVAYELPQRRPNSANDPELDSGYQFTRLGVRFVEACRAPNGAVGDGND